MKVQNATAKETPLSVQLAPILGLAPEFIGVTEGPEGDLEVVALARGSDWDSAQEIAPDKQAAVLAWCKARQQNKIGRERVISG